MKVLNLKCSHQHPFEGWFASEDDFQSQLSRGLIECPLCADSGIKKLPSAPRLNLGGHPVPSAESQQGIQSARLNAAAPMPTGVPQHNAAAIGLDAVTGIQVGSSPAEQAAFFKALRHVVENTEDVGDKFADEARAMHYGDVETRSIRGRASLHEAIGLLEEGIEIMPLPIPAALKGTLQ